MKWRVCVAAVFVATLVGCSTTVSGSPVTATRAAGNDVDVALLDPGNYPTKPQLPLGTAGDAGTGALVEARRLADNVVGPWQVDPTLVHRSSLTGVVKSTAALSSIHGKGMGEAAAAHHFVTAFGSIRTAYIGGVQKLGNEQTDLTNVVIEFASPQDATAAATDLAERARVLPPLLPGEPSTPTKPIAVPGYPGTTAVTYSYGVDSGYPHVRAYTAHDRYVLCQMVQSREGPQKAAELVAATLDRQRPLIDQFRPTPSDQLAALALDPDGLLSRTLPPKRETGTVNDGVYGPRGILHFQSDPAGSHTLFDSARLQRAARGTSHVYEASDAAAAAKIVDGFHTEAQGQQYAPAAGINGMPIAKCLAHNPSGGKRAGFYCLAVADRYAIEVSSGQEADAHQQVAAQYLMLTGK